MQHAAASAATKAPQTAELSEMLRLSVGPALVAALVGSLAFAVPLSAGETRRIEGLEFDEIVVLGSIKVEIRQGDTPVLQIQGPDESIALATFSTKGDTLFLSSKKNSKRRELQKLRFRVIAPNLRELKLKGSGDVYVKPWTFEGRGKRDTMYVGLEGPGDIKLFSVEGSAIEMTVKGSGNIKAQSIEVEQIEAYVAGTGDLFIQTLTADEARFTVTGSGDIAVTDSGYVRELDANVVGSGDARLENVRCDSAELNVVGSGDIAVGEVLKTLEASVLGSGDIRFRGNPELEKFEIGSGEVRRLD